jgi:hypothetical protein
MRAWNTWSCGLSLVLVALAGPGARAQGPAAPGLGRPVPLEAAPGPVLQTPLVYTPPPEPAPPPAAVLDPGPNGWAPYEPLSTPAGFFFDVQTVILYPTLKDHVVNTSGSAPAQLQVPTVSLDLTASPTFEFGYRLPDSAGYFAASYRFLASQGTGTTTIDGAPFDAKTRLDVETFDLDYGTTPLEVYPRTFLAARLGARVQNFFFDSSVNGPYFQQASNNFFGAGFHGRLDLVRRIEAVRGLSLFGRVEAAELIGLITQKFRQSEVLADGTTQTSFTYYRHSQSPPQILLQAGLSYVPPVFTNVTLTAGYQFEDYFYLAQFNTQAGPSASRGELMTNGFFLRGQVDF